MLITLYKRDRRGQTRYYSIDERQGHLFADYTFSVYWGTTLTAGREKLHRFDTRQAMNKKLQGLITDRVNNGYRVLYSFFRNQEYQHLRSALQRAAVS